MIKVSSSFDGNGAIAHVKAEGWDRIRRCVVFFWSAVQQQLNVSNPRPYTTPSKPGEPPRKRTGFLAANVIYELEKDQLAGRVGVLRNALYGLFLEIGTGRMAARPWLKATLDKTMPQLKAICEGGKAGGP